MSMETKHGPGQRAARAPNEGYERSDASPRSLSKWAVLLAIVLVVVFLAMWWLFDFFGKEQSLGRPASPFENARVLPPRPRLQVEPRADLHAYCVQQLATLNSYGWEDQHNGVVRIPVDRAMDLILQQGLPARAARRHSGGREQSGAFCAEGDGRARTVRVRHRARCGSRDERGGEALVACFRGAICCCDHVAFDFEWLSVCEELNQVFVSGKFGLRNRVLGALAVAFAALALASGAARAAGVRPYAKRGRAPGPAEAGGH